MNVIYRNFSAGDIDEIIDFWNQNSGWETNMDRAEFNLRFCSSPFGHPILMLAFEKKEIMALFCFLPVNVTINGKELKSYRSFGAVIKESFREKFGITSFLTGKHPIIQLYNRGMEVALAENAVISYSLPDPRWGKILKVFPFETCKYPLWSYHLRLEIPAQLEENITIRNTTPDDSEINRLWNNVIKADYCTLTRNSLFYQSKVKISHGQYKLKGVYLGEKLVGLFTLSFKAQAYQWMIGDLLTLDDGDMLELTIRAACSVANEELSNISPEAGKKYKAAILATRTIEPRVKKLGFYRDVYDFVFALQVLNRRVVSKKEAAFENWYISAND